MNNGLPKKKADRKGGSERFVLDGQPLDSGLLNLWQFYVVSQDFLNDYQRRQESITLESLLGLGIKPVGFFQLAERVEHCAS